MVRAVAGDAWGNVITTAITASATLTAVWLTQRHAEVVRHQDRRDERRTEQRAVIADVLLTGHEWERTADGVKLAAGAVPPDHSATMGAFEVFYGGGRA